MTLINQGLFKEIVTGELGHRGPKGRVLRPAGSNIEARRPESGGWGSWGGGSQPPPHQLAVWGSAVSSPSGVWVNDE